MESSAPSDCEVRAVIKFLNAGVTGLKIHRRLSNIHGAGNVVSPGHIYKWIECFNAGWSHKHNEHWTGCPWDSINDETIACVHTLLAEDCWFTISEIYHKMAEHYLMQTSHTTIFCILTEELEMRKVTARWVPCMLIEDNYRNHMGQN